MSDSTELEARLLWGLILAAGDGRRLQDYIHQLRGNGYPSNILISSATAPCWSIPFIEPRS